MCFSAVASYSAAAALIPVGVASITVAAQKKQYSWIPVAAMPLLFGIQQFIEGKVWNGMDSGDADSAKLWALGFLFFSHALWPAYSPFMVWKLEKNEVRKKILLAIVFLGAFLGAVSYIPFVFQPERYIPTVINCRLDYATSVVLGQLPTRGIYLIVVLGCFFVSSLKTIRRYGTMVAVSIVMTFAFWKFAFVSVWCFWAALVSSYLLYVLYKLPSLAQPKEVLPDNSPIDSI
jgi:hypothetical protein